MVRAGDPADDPALLGLFSLVTLLAHPRMNRDPHARAAAWYRKPRPTFVDALAVVRRQLWQTAPFPISSAADDVVEVPRALLDHLTDALCYAA